MLKGFWRQGIGWNGCFFGVVLFFLNFGVDAGCIHLGACVFADRISRLG